MLCVSTIINSSHAISKQLHTYGIIKYSSAAAAQECLKLNIDGKELQEIPLKSISNAKRNTLVKKN